MKKVQSQLLVSEVTRDRADALAVVRQEPRAEIWRIALEGGGLRALEAQHAEALTELRQAAQDMSLTVPALVQKMIADRYTLDDVRGRKRYPVRAATGA